MRQDKQGRGELLGAGERIQTCAPPAGPPCRSTRPLFVSRCRANVAHIIQSWPDSGLGFQFKILRSFLFVPSSLRTFCITAEFRDLIRCREARNLRDAPHQRADLVARPFVFEYIYIYIYMYICRQREARNLCDAPHQRADLAARPALGVRVHPAAFREFKLPWREAGPPNHHDDKVDPNPNLQRLRCGVGFSTLQGLHGYLAHKTYP